MKTLLHLTNVESNDVYVQQRHRLYCDYIMGQQQPYNYNWMYYNISQNEDEIINVVPLSQIPKEFIQSKVNKFNDAMNK